MPRNLVILNWNRVHFVRLLGLFARSGRNEGASPAQCKAEQNDHEFQHQRHESTSVLLHTFSPELVPIGAGK